MKDGKLFEVENKFMKKALSLAKKAMKEGEIPVGAIVVENDKIIGEGYNRQLQDNDPTAHAEIVALRSAGKEKNNFRLDGARMFVTIQPCNMCMEAIRRARIEKVYYASYKAIPSTHNVEYREVVEYTEESSRILKRFFEVKR